MPAGFAGEEVGEWGHYGNYRFEWRNVIQSRGRQPLRESCTDIIFGGMHKVHSLPPTPAQAHGQQHVHTLIKQRLFGDFRVKFFCLCGQRSAISCLLRLSVNLSEMSSTTSLCLLLANVPFPFLSSHTALPGSLSQAYLEFEKNVANPSMHFLSDHNDSRWRNREAKKKDYLLPDIVLEALGISELMSAKHSEPLLGMTNNFGGSSCVQATCRHLGVNPFTALVECFVLLKTQSNSRVWMELRVKTCDFQSLFAMDFGKLGKTFSLLRPQFFQIAERKGNICLCHTATCLCGSKMLLMERSFRRW